MARLALGLTLLLGAGCAAGGFAVRFGTVHYAGEAWTLAVDEPTPQRGTGGTRGWQLQAAEPERASWYYTESIHEWPPERVLLLLALEDAAGVGGTGAAAGSWQAAWARPGLVARSALAQVADVQWLGDPVRGLTEGIETERSPVVLRSGTAWGASLSGGFHVRGHVACRRDARAPLIACAVAGLASEDAPVVQPADFDADADLQANATWLDGWLAGVQLRRR